MLTDFPYLGLAFSLVCLIIWLCEVDTLLLTLSFLVEIWKNYTVCVLQFTNHLSLFILKSSYLCCADFFRCKLYCR